jgi:hypothetical protein
VYRQIVTIFFEILLIIILIIMTIIIFIILIIILNSIRPKLIGFGAPAKPN